MKIIESYQRDERIIKSVPHGGAVGHNKGNYEQFAVKFQITTVSFQLVHNRGLSIQSE